jgi:hypothetical protein
MNLRTIKISGLRVSRLLGFWSAVVGGYRSGDLGAVGVVRLLLGGVYGWVFGRGVGSGVARWRYRKCVGCPLGAGGIPGGGRICVGCGCYAPYKVVFAEKGGCPMGKW